MLVGSALLTTISMVLALILASALALGGCAAVDTPVSNTAGSANNVAATNISAGTRATTPVDPADSTDATSPSTNQATLIVDASALFKQGQAGQAQAAAIGSAGIAVSQVSFQPGETIATVLEQAGFRVETTGQPVGCGIYAINGLANTQKTPNETKGGSAASGDASLWSCKLNSDLIKDNAAATTLNSIDKVIQLTYGG
jgi:hypothetical protein